MTAATKRLFIKTYGCQMNVYDSERMKDVLAPLGYSSTDTPEDADLVLLNTCHIREKATEKVFSELGQLKRLKQASGGKMLLGVTSLWIRPSAFPDLDSALCKASSPCRTSCKK